MLVILMLVPLILCMFIDQFAFLLLAIPLYEPIIRTYGFDPMWFWTLFLINLTIGSITPPFGYTLFALKGAAQDTSLKEIYRSAWPVVVIFLIGLALFAAVPGLVTFLPSLL
jgi:TRAP-type C4-dicarboxylate transport system permease large subunit